MVRIETEKRNVKGVMIDGYVPNLETLRNFDWKDLKNHLPKTEWYQYGIPSYLRKNLSEKRVLRIFGTLVYGLREKFCQLRDEKGRTRSAYFPRTSGQNYFSLEKRIATIHKKELGNFLPIFTKEYRHDEELGRKLYLQNVIIYPTNPLISCNKIEECNSNWLKKLGFTAKNKEDYVDFEAFNNAWVKVLENFIKNAYEVKFI